jgi:uncharacterized protein (DUF433 family)
MDLTATHIPHSSTTTGTVPVLREHIVSTPDTCGGKPRIAGNRIQVKHVAIMHERQGMSTQAIVSEYPHITLADIYAALAYYHDHREAINAEIVQPSRLKDALEARNAHGTDDTVPPG